jgi:hypothetical protein
MDTPFPLTDAPIDVMDTPFPLTDVPIDVMDTFFPLKDAPIDVMDTPFPLKDAPIDVMAQQACRPCDRGSGTLLDHVRCRPGALLRSMRRARDGNPGRQCCARRGGCRTPRGWA